MEGVVVVANDHVVLLGHFSSVSQLLVLVLQSGHLELVLLDYLVQRHFDLSTVVILFDLCPLLHLGQTQRFA